MTPRLRRKQDAFGQEIRAALTDPDTMEIIERDDGRIEAYSATARGRPAAS